MSRPAAATKAVGRGVPPNSAIGTVSGREDGDEDGRLVVAADRDTDGDTVTVDVDVAVAVWFVTDDEGNSSDVSSR